MAICIFTRKSNDLYYLIFDVQFQGLYRSCTVWTVECASLSTMGQSTALELCRVLEDPTHEHSCWRALRDLYRRVPRDEECKMTVCACLLHFHQYVRPVFNLLSAGPFDCGQLRLEWVLCPMMLESSSFPDLQVELGHIPTPLVFLFWRRLISFCWLQCVLACMFSTSGYVIFKPRKLRDVERDQWLPLVSGLELLSCLQHLFYFPHCSWAVPMLVSALVLMSYMKLLKHVFCHCAW